MRCPKCGTENSPAHKFCGACGAALGAADLAERDGALSQAEKVRRVERELAGLNCGRCGYLTCRQNAEAIVRGLSPYDACVRTSPEARQRIRQILGEPARVPLWVSAWQLLTSLRLAVGLIAALVALSIVGTVIPQGQSDLFYIERFGRRGYNLIRGFAAHRLFHSGYYLSLLVLLAANTLACLIKRLRVSWQLWRPPPGSAAAQDGVALAHALAPEDALGRVQAVLTQRGYRVAKNGRQLRAHRRRVGRLGVDLFHASLLLFLIGAILGGALGFERFQVAHKGEVFDVPGADFQVRVDDLWTENYADSALIRDWYTRLTVIEREQAVLTRTIEVNHPLTYKGISFYQASFGADWQGRPQLSLAVERAADGARLGEYEVTVDESFPLDERGQWTAKLIAFYPDFLMTEYGPINRSPRLNNPAAFLEVYREGAPAYRGWTFVHFPDTQIWAAVSSAGQPPEGAAPHDGPSRMPYRIELVGMHAPEFTGLQISYNPGIWLIYASFVLMTLGLFLNFYLPPRWVWARAEREAVFLGGTGRDEQEFAGELEALVERVRARLAATPTKGGRIHA